MGRRHYDLSALRAEWAMVGCTLPAGGTSMTRTLGFNRQEVHRACHSRKHAEAARSGDLTAETEEGAAAVPQSGARISADKWKALPIISVDHCYRTTIAPLERSAPINIQCDNHQRTGVMSSGDHLTSQDLYNKPGTTAKQSGRPPNEPVDLSVAFPTYSSNLSDTSDEALGDLMLGDIQAFGTIEDVDPAQAEQSPPVCERNNPQDFPMGEFLAMNGEEDVLVELHTIPEADRIFPLDAMESISNEQGSPDVPNTDDNIDMVTQGHYALIEMVPQLDLSWFDMDSTMS